MGRELWHLIEAHQHTTPYGVSIRGIAKAAGVGHSTLAKWEAMQKMPTPEHLLAVARQINVPYRVALDAALKDAGYLPETRIKKPGATRQAGDIVVDDLAETIDEVPATRHRTGEEPS